MQDKKQPIDDWAVICEEVHRVFEQSGLEKVWRTDPIAEANGKDQKELWFVTTRGDVELAFRGDSHNWKATSIIHQCRINRPRDEDRDHRWMHVYAEGPFYPKDVELHTAHFINMAEELGVSIAMHEGSLDG